MTKFLEVALRNAARGFRVHPVNGKDAMLKGWPTVASTDETQIRAWAVKYPHHNVGVAAGHPDPNAAFVVAIVDSDRVSRLKELSGEDAADWFNTYSVTSGRPDRAHFYYLMTPEVSAYGNKKWAEPGIDGNVFELKVMGGQVVAEGSVHPITGSVYTHTDRPLIVFPAGLLALMRECRGKDDAPRERIPREKISEGGRHDALVQEAGRILRVTEMSKPVLTAHLEDFNEQHLEPPLDSEEVERIALSCNWQPKPPPPQVYCGGSNVEIAAELAPELVEELDKELQAVPLPDYHLMVFEDTLYMDFARLAQKGNFIPLAFLIEGAMTYVGAAMSDYLQGSKEGVTPRLYTNMLGFPGVGKGSTFKRIRLIIPFNGLYSVVSDKVMPPPCSALMCSVASENGVNMALLQRPAVILDMEELDILFEKTGIQGSGGSLMSIIRTCFDDTNPRISVCKGRPEVAGTAYLSLLGGMTPALWRRAMEGRDSYGSGLGGRFNLVASNETRIASTLNRIDVSHIQAELDKRLTALENNNMTTIATDDAALRLLGEWWGDNRTGKPHYNRVNVIAHRKALHLAWIRDLPTITPEIMRHALLLADYLVKVREVYAVTKGEDKTAIGENRVLHILRQVAPKAVRTAQLVALLDGEMSRAGVFASLRALAESGEAEKLSVKDESCCKPYNVYRASPNH